MKELFDIYYTYFILFIVSRRVLSIFKFILSPVYNFKSFDKNYIECFYLEKNRLAIFKNNFLLTIILSILPIYIKKGYYIPTRPIINLNKIILNTC